MSNNTNPLQSVSGMALGFQGAVAEAIQTLDRVLEAFRRAGWERLIEMFATPNERRMMHNKRKRIRRKYYNRVKRRICR